MQPPPREMSKDHPRSPRLCTYRPRKRGDLIHEGIRLRADPGARQTPTLARANRKAIQPDQTPHASRDGNEESRVGQPITERSGIIVIKGAQSITEH